MRSVAILTTFGDLPSGYGLVPVVLNQLTMLVEHGYKPSLFVQEGFEKHSDAAKIPEGVEIKPFIPFLHLYHYFDNTRKQNNNVDAKGTYVTGSPFSPITDFNKQVKAIEDMLEPELVKHDVVITHDILFQVAFVVHNQAIRNIAKRHPKIKWIHWVHSGPSPRPKNPKGIHKLRYTGMPNSVIVAPNKSMSAKFAEMYNISRSEVKCVYHVFDVFRFFDMHPFSRQFIKKHDLLSPDVLCVWATRLDAPVMKGYKNAVRIIAQLNKLCSAKLVFLNSSSNSVKARSVIKSLRDQADDWGFPQKNLVFSSEEGVNWEIGVPQKVVRDLMWIANLFVFPSKSETFSFAMIEAAVCKNLLVLNEDLSVMKELAGDNALYGGFGSDWGGVVIKRNIPDPYGSYMNDARIILDELKKYKPLAQQRKVLRVFNIKWVFKNQLKPLIEE